MFEISHRTVRKFAETDFGENIIYMVFSVFSCSDDVISPTTVVECACANPEHESTLPFFGMSLYAFVCSGFRLGTADSSLKDFNLHFRVLG